MIINQTLLFMLSVLKLPRRRPTLIKVCHHVVAKRIQYHSIVIADGIKRRFKNNRLRSVSYTHLDVYKRQIYLLPAVKVSPRIFLVLCALPKTTHAAVARTTSSTLDIFLPTNEARRGGAVSYTHLIFCRRTKM